ncbi:MAG: acetoacetate decarboxylase family protein [Candidatus Thorarchaeota archaeon]
MDERELEFFTDIQFEDIVVSGRTFRSPFLYYDFSRITATFPAPIPKIQKTLPSEKLAPVEIRPNTTLVTFVAYEYRGMEGIQPYNEFGVIIPTTHKERNLPGSYVTHLPVTTEEARWGGVEIYGFPKFIADISFEDRENVCKSRVSLDGKDIISLEVRKTETHLESSEVYTYTVLEGKIVRTYVQIQGFVSTGNDERGATVHLGDHTIANEIKAFGFDEVPISYSYSPRMQSLLHKPGELLSM